MDNMLSRGQKMVLSVLKSADQGNNTQEQYGAVFFEHSDSESEPELYRGKYTLFMYL